MPDLIVDSDVLFVTQEDWQSENRRDAVLESIVDLCNFVDDHDKQVFWTDLLDEAMWTTPQPLPWRSEPSTRNKIIPILHQKLLPHLNRVGDISGYAPVTPNPILVNSYPDQNIRSEFLRLVGYVGEIEEDWVFFTTTSNSGMCTRNLTFDDGTRTISHPYVIVKAAQYFTHECVHNFYWPETLDDIKMFQAAITINSNQAHNDTVGKTPQRFIFSKVFSLDLIGTTNDRQSIWCSLSKRIAYGQQKAVSDGGLRDEALNAKSERRFRVNGECRIHYSYTEDGEIEFLKYYGEGEHDDGL